MGRKVETPRGIILRLKHFAWLIAAATGGRFAQTSVTLYGRVDGGIEYLNHIAKPNGGSGTRWSAESGDWGTSMFGLKGIEDLGGGLSTVFNLETAFQVMNARPAAAACGRGARTSG